MRHAHLRAVIAVLPNVPRANDHCIWPGVLPLRQLSDDVCTTATMVVAGCAMTHLVVATAQAITSASAYRCYEPPRRKHIVCTQNVKGSLKREAIFLIIVNYSFIFPKSPRLPREDAQNENTGGDATLKYPHQKPWRHRFWERLRGSSSVKMKKMKYIVLWGGHRLNVPSLREFRWAMTKKKKRKIYT